MPKKPTEPELIKCANLAETLAGAISNVTLLLPEGAHQNIVTDLTRQLRQSASEAQAISRRLRRMQTLSENSSGKYLVLIGDTVRPATPDEVLRQVMHYPRAGVSLGDLITNGRIDEDLDIIALP